MTMRRRDKGRKIGKERKQTYSIQLSTRKLVDLVDVHGETVDDGAGYRFDTRLDHFCAILIKEYYDTLRRRIRRRKTDFYNTGGCFSLFVHTESRTHKWEGRHARRTRVGWR